MCRAGEITSRLLVFIALWKSSHFTKLPPGTHPAGASRNVLPGRQIAFLAIAEPASREAGWLRRALERDVAVLNVGAPEFVPPVFDVTASQIESGDDISRRMTPFLPVSSFR